MENEGKQRVTALRRKWELFASYANRAACCKFSVSVGRGADLASRRRLIQKSGTEVPLFARVR
jgi:hypothetical protein